MEGIHDLQNLPFTLREKFPKKHKNVKLRTQEKSSLTVKNISLFQRSPFLFQSTILLNTNR